MADITMCRNEDCEKKEECYRYKATPNPYWQPYAAIEPDENGECLSFMKISDMAPCQFSCLDEGKF